MTQYQQRYFTNWSAPFCGIQALKDMDSKTLKKVLGQVSRAFPEKISILLICTPALCTSKHGMRVCLSLNHGFQVNLPSWVNFPDFERVGWLNSVMGMPLPNTCVNSVVSPHPADLPPVVVSVRLPPVPEMQPSHLSSLFDTAVLVTSLFLTLFTMPKRLVQFRIVVILTLEI